MTEPTPFAPVPVDIPAGHPMLDTIHADLRDFAKAGPSGSELAAALELIKSAGVSIADIEAAHAVAMPAIRRAIGATPGHTCHCCHVPATQQWPRHATPAEAEDWHAAREQHIRAHNDGRPEAAYVANRADTVTLAVHGCNNHVVDDPRRTHDADCGGHGACQCGDDADG